MEFKKTIIENFYINPSFITMTYETINPDREKYNTTTYHENFKNNITKGILSDHGKKNIKRCLDWFYAVTPVKSYKDSKTGKSVNFKLIMITLTLPSKQKHSDQYIKKYMLQQFIDSVKYYSRQKEYKGNSETGLKNFFWRAERQDNGNIHFHIITDAFLHRNYILSRWNGICYKEGYVQEYQQKMKRIYQDGFNYNADRDNNCGYEVAEQRYFKGVRCDWTQPNSTDVKPILTIKRLKCYVSKYLTKEKFNKSTVSEQAERVEGIQGRIWFVSRKFSKIKNFVLSVNDNIRQELRCLFAKASEKVINSDFYQIILVGWQELKRFNCYHLYNWFQNELKLQFCIK